MHQQTYCHTLLQPFFKIFLFRIYAPTIHSTDIDSDETSAPASTHLRANPATTNQSTNDTQIPNHTHTTNSAPIQPPHPYSLHKNTHPLDAAQATDVDVDVDADAQTLMQHRCSRSPIPVHNWTGQDRQDQIEPGKTGLDQVRPDRTRPDQVSDRPRTEPDGTGTGHDLTGHCQTGRIQDQIEPDQTRQNQIRPGQAVGFAFDETSRPASANFSAKPDSTLLRNASRAGAVVGVDVV